MSQEAEPGAAADGGAGFVPRTCELIGAPPLLSCVAVRRHGGSGTVRPRLQTTRDPPARAEVQPINDGLVAAIKLLKARPAAVVEQDLIKGAA